MNIKDNDTKDNGSKVKDRKECINQNDTIRIYSYSFNPLIPHSQVNVSYKHWKREQSEKDKLISKQEKNKLKKIHNEFLLRRLLFSEKWNIETYKNSLQWNSGKFHANGFF